MKLPSKSPLVRKKFLKNFAISVLSFLLFGENQALGLNNCPDETEAIYATTIRGNEGSNIIWGTGSDRIFGLEGDDELNGCHGDDRLEGGPGMDTLIGGKGKDHFVFDSKMEGDNNDIIFDFKAGEDKIVLSRKVFSSLRENDDLTKLNPTELALGRSARSSEVRILFDPNKSILSYDSDGNGINKAIPFAKVKDIKKIDPNSFVLEGNPTISIATNASKLVYSNLIIILLLILLLERIICHVWSHPFSLSSSHADKKRQQNSIYSNSSNLDEYKQKSMNDDKMLLDRLNEIIELAHPLSRLDVSIDELKKSIGEIISSLKYSSIQNQQSESKHVAHDDSDSSQAAQSLAVHLVKSTNSNPLTKLIENICCAVDRNDRALLLEMALHELNLVDDFEDEYLRRSNQKTQLQIAQDNGSYYLINCDERYWVIPSIRTLKNFSMNQPPKGIFNYEPQEIDSPRLRQPAEVREVSGLWEVINMGIIVVPT
jgi:hypothetical protein